MSVYKRGDAWHYEFLFAGKRIRESAKTNSKTVAKEAERKRRRELEEGYNGLTKEDRSWRVVTFAEAADSYFADYKLKHRPHSVSYMRNCLAHLKEHVGDMLLIEIGVVTVKEYQSSRLRQEASAKCINEEVMILLGIMRELGDVIRARMKRDKTLKLAYQKYEGKALTADEVKALYDAAEVIEPDPGEKKDLKAVRSEMIKLAIAIPLNTTLRDEEVRTLLWERINFLKDILTVGKSKTAAGTGRTIPINSELRAMLENYRKWYESKIGPATPDRYVFPSCENRKWDPTRSIGSFKTAWKTVRARAGVKARYHDLRHTAITNLCESGASEETIMAIAGHVAREMLSRYAHIRTEAKRKALEAISNRTVGVPAAEKAAS